jgi:hypothetical protein
LKNNFENACASPNRQVNTLSSTKFDVNSLKNNCNSFPLTNTHGDVGGEMMQGLTISGDDGCSSDNLSLQLRHRNCIVIQFAFTGTDFMFKHVWELPDICAVVLFFCQIS